MEETALKTSVNLEFAARDVLEAVRRKDTIIVIDVLRCCSTMIVALANGARGVIPVKTVKEAFMLHEKHPEYVLAGERGGLKPKGFDFGNSPLELQPEKVKGKMIILTTSHGTRAISFAKRAKRVLIGAFLNAETAAKTAFEAAEEENVGISMALSGKRGRFFLEDFLCAGAITEYLPDEKLELSDAAKAALLAFRKAHGQLKEVVKDSDHARYLRTLGLENDVEFCAQMNAFKIVPFLKNDMITMGNC